VFGVQIEADTREAYFAAVGDREAELRELDTFIRQHAPDLPPVLSQTMGAVLGYGEQPYQSKSMKEPIDWPVVALAAQKRHISLYLCVLEDGEYVAEKHAAELGQVSCGKSCVRFTKADKINRDGLARILADINRRFVAGERLYAV
jgi:Domain of unknown function (DU1801)